MRLRTEINCQPSKIKINHSDKILLLGSCFSTEIGSLLERHQFHTSVNPFGTIYNAYSIAKLINKSCHNQTIDASEVLLNSTTGLYHHFDFHSSFNHPNPNTVLDHCNNTLRQTKSILTDASLIVITLGTSYIHQHHTHGLVANCHKVSSQSFNKQLLSIQEQYTSLTQAIANIRTINKNATFLFTVSPVRHIKEGLANNQLSKAYLRSTVEALIQEHEDCIYFPSYEVLVDDLRDYRFYKEDLIHPNATAVKYIWDLFGNTYFDPTTIAINREVDKLLLSITHRPLNPQSEGSKKHRVETLEKIKDFETKHPEISLQDYIRKTVGPI